MPCQDLPFRIDLGADRLSGANEDASSKRTPQAAEATNDDGLEGIEKACGSYGGIEVRADAEMEGGHGDHDHGNGSDQREDAAAIEAHQPGDFRIVGSGTEGAADLGSMNQIVQYQNDADGGGEGQ